MAKILEKGKVSFSQAIKDFVKGYFDFRGVSTRAGYWWATLGITLSYLVLVIPTFIFSFNKAYYESPATLLMLLVIFLFSLVLVIPTLALHVRRLRDIGLRSKTILTVYIVYYALYASLMTSVYSSAMTMLSHSFSEGYRQPVVNTVSFASPLLTFFFILLSVFFTVSVFLPSKMLATSSQHAILRSIFITK